jgi:hypothetical protein
MTPPSDDALRNVLGRNLQTASLRALAILAVFAFLGAACTYLLR